jgi:Immunoglobulin domain
MHTLNPPMSFLRFLACLSLFCPWLCVGSPSIVSDPVSLEVTFPAPLPTTDLSQSVFPGAEIVFRPVPGPYPVPFPTQLDIRFSPAGDSYTGLGTIGPWYYQSAADGSAVLRFYVWEDGGRQIFYREYILQTNGTYQVYVRNTDDERVLIQAGGYQVFGYEDARSRSIATFSVSVDDADAATFQWYFDGAPLVDGVSSPFIYYFESIVRPGQTAISGSQTATLSISNVTRLNAGSYQCVVSSPSGVVTSAVATLTVNGHPTRDLTPPTAQITMPRESKFRGTDPIRVTFISGTASDDTGVGTVYLLFGTNHYGPMNIGPRGNSAKDSLWGGNVYLQPGSNYLEAYAVDVYGNRSATTNSQDSLWGGNVYLQPGSNYLGVYAVDVYGNRSATNSRVIYYQNPAPKSGHHERAGRLTFDSLTNASYRFPIYGVDGDDLARLMVTGPSVTLLTGWNPNNRTPALRLDSSVASNYVITLSGIRAPFALLGFEVVSATGSFTLKDEATGAYYTYDGSIGRVKLGPAFRRTEYVELTVNGQVVLDNIEYRLLEHAPVASVRVWHELKLPPITAAGGTLFNYRPPGHLETASSYQYPGYRGFWHYLLAPDTNAIPFVLDASGSRDPDHDGLKFSWSTYIGGDEGDFFPLMGGVPTSSPFFKNRSGELVNTARHELVLTVQDKYLADRLWFGVVVLTPKDATGIIWDWLQEHFDSENDPRGVVRGRLVPVLQEAESQFAAAQTQAGRRSLRKFEQLATAHLRRMDWRVAETMLAFTDAVLEVTKKQGQ